MYLLATTATVTGELDLGASDSSIKYDLWHHPPRSLHVRRPRCMLPISPEKRPFIKAEDSRLMYLSIDDGGGLKPPAKDEGGECMHAA